MRSLVAFAAVLGSLLGAAPTSAATFFESPSGNIKCVMDKSSGVRCDIGVRDWKPPPKPDWCPVDWGNGLEVSARGRARFTCAGDAVPKTGRSHTATRSGAGATAAARGARACAA